MAFRKLKYKNVKGTRSGQTLRSGEIAVDETSSQLFMGDNSTQGGNPITSLISFKHINANHTLTSGEIVVCLQGTYNVTAPAGADGFTAMVINTADSGTRTLVQPGQSNTAMSGSEVHYVIWNGSGYNRSFKDS